MKSDVFSLYFAMEEDLSARVVNYRAWFLHFLLHFVCYLSQLVLKRKKNNHYKAEVVETT